MVWQGIVEMSGIVDGMVNWWENKQGPVLHLRPLGDFNFTVMLPSAVAAFSGSAMIWISSRTLSPNFIRPIGVGVVLLRRGWSRGASYRVEREVCEL
jgi:hypothetical protein